MRDPGWVKIRIRDKHSGSATLQFFDGIAHPERVYIEENQMVIPPSSMLEIIEAGEDPCSC